MEYPEHEKLTMVKDNSQLLGEFLDWAGEGNYHLCERAIKNEGSPFETVVYNPTVRSIPKLLADFYGIDLMKLEKEKEQMMVEIRELQTTK